MSAAIDCVVVGAGVVGLAVARALARSGREVVVLEAQSAIGNGISSRSSEVIHAGLYYPAGSLKARLCVAGRHAMYAYCAERGVAHRRCGKLVVAVEPAQEAALQRLHALARGNGVDDAVLLAGDDARSLEPALRCSAALLSPSTGIVDSHALMLALLGDAEDHGAMLARKSPLLHAEARGDGIELHVGGDEPMQVVARTLVNCAGLDAPRVASTIDGLDHDHVPRAHLCKGNYFALSGRAPFSRLIYPLPDAAGLGIHLTFDLGGQARFGPDVEWIDAIDYTVNERRAELFPASIRTWWPGLPANALRPDYAGIRPKIAAQGEPAADFAIHGPEVHGVRGLVNLFGIESPGITASLAIGDEVLRRLDGS